ISRPFHPPLEPRETRAELAPQTPGPCGLTRIGRWGRKECLGTSSFDIVFRYGTRKLPQIRATRRARLVRSGQPRGNHVCMVPRMGFSERALANLKPGGRSSRRIQPATHSHMDPCCRLDLIFSFLDRARKPLNCAVRSEHRTKPRTICQAER